MKFLLYYLTVIITYVTYCSCDDLCSSRIETVKNTVEGKCLTQLKALCKRNDLLLALWDSSSREIHSGLTATNNLDLGNYDLCIGIDEVGIKGKFCPFQWATQVPVNTLANAVAVAELYNHVPSSQIQEKNIVSYGAGQSETLSLVGSMCIPDACTPEEFTSVFNPYIYPVDYSIRNATTNCFTKDEISNMTTFEIVVTICIGLIFLLVVACTIFHAVLLNTRSGEPHELVKAFSAIHNGQKLLHTSTSNAEQINCIHGLRFLSILWVIAGHTFACEEILPTLNVHDVETWRSHLYTQYILAGPYAVDTFFCISGLLLAYGYMKQVKDVSVAKQIKSVPLMILHRYLRLTPAAAAIFFVSISFLKALGNGPIWPMYVDAINEPCRKYWWRYFLYIQNYSSEICYTQTWYLSADMQMFLAAPIVLIPAAVYYRKKLRWVLSSLAALTVFCVALSIAILYIVDDYDNDYDTHSRLSDYIIGIMGGIVLHSCRGKAVKMKKIVNLVLWIVVVAVMLFLILYLHDVLNNPTKDKKAFFNTIQKPIWSACILWIVFACHHGYGGILNKFLSTPFLQIGSRLSYCMYCVHATVILYNVGTTRTYQYFTDYFSLYLLCGNIIVCYIVATIWTLTFESPMIILNKMLLGKLGSPKK